MNCEKILMNGELISQEVEIQGVILQIEILNKCWNLITT